jgi:hypothetical protein
MSTKLQPQKISRSLVEAAADALGGLPARPPLPGEVRALANPEMDAKRQAFATAAAAADAAAAPDPIVNTGRLVQQAIGRTVIEETPAPTLGHPIFDTPPALSDRAAKVAEARNGLAELTRTILAAGDTLLPALAELEKVSGVTTAEKFDPKVATKYLTDLVAVVRKLVPEPVAETPEAKAEEPAAAAAK